MIAITTGDHRGIGPEVIAKGLYSLRKTMKPHDIVIFGAPRLYKPFQKLLPTQQVCWSEKEVFNSNWDGPQKRALNFILPDVSLRTKEMRAAFLCGRYIELAIKGALNGLFSAIVTGPIDKTELIKGGYHFDGHTEMLQSYSSQQGLKPSVTMMLAAPRMRISLVTTHVALKDVSAKLSSEKILTTLKNTNLGLQDYFGIKSPRLAVLGLNPHCGDSGLFGKEEQEIIEPTLKIARDQGIDVKGPFAADGFFGQWKTRHQKAFDAIVCMYHDQGLIPIKLFDFKNTVNITLGLPLIRTSVDHGIGLDIAGKNTADPSSFLAALKLAKTICRRKS